MKIFQKIKSFWKKLDEKTRMSEVEAIELIGNIAQQYGYKVILIKNLRNHTNELPRLIPASPNLEILSNN
jgi:hypothetical protein